MKIQLESGFGQNLIHSYGPGQIRINQEVYVHSLIVTPARIIVDWPPASFEELAAPHFQQIADLAPEVVILGTGAKLRFPPSAVTRALIEANVGVEVMDTGAACRTYNILAGDGRRVVAALLMIEGN
jgi:uncharacterized protein